MDHRPSLGNILWPSTIRLRTETSHQERLFQRINPSTVTYAQAGAHRLERPLQYLQYSSWYSIYNKARLGKKENFRSRSQPSNNIKEKGDRVPQIMAFLLKGLPCMDSFTIKSTPSPRCSPHISCPIFLTYQAPATHYFILLQGHEQPPCITPANISL